MGQNNSGTNHEGEIAAGKFTISPEPLVGAEEKNRSALSEELETAPAVGSATEAPAYEDLGSLPESYGEPTLFLVARDPHWIFAYWDVNWVATGASKFYLKVYVPGGVEVATVEVKPEARNWYVEVGNANTTYYSEIGYFSPQGVWQPLAQSSETTTPNESISHEEVANFATVPLHLSLERLIEMVKTQRNHGESLVQVLSRLQGHHTELAFPGTTPAWSEEQKQVLAALFSDETVDLTGMSSEQVNSMLHQQLQQRLTSESSSGLSSQGRLAELLGGESSLFSGFVTSWFMGAGGALSSGAGFGAETAFSSGGFSGNLGGVGSSWSAQPFGVKRERGFFMHVNAEVIFYGGTDPGAKVWIDGKQVTLQPDGSFRYHFKFPDGNYNIPIVAESPDGVETRSATLDFKRATGRTGEVGHTGQPAELSPPMGAQ